MFRFLWFPQLYIALLCICIVSFTFVFRMFVSYFILFLGWLLVLYFSLVAPAIMLLCSSCTLCIVYMCSWQINDNDDVMLCRQCCNPQPPPREFLDPGKYSGGARGDAIWSHGSYTCRDDILTRLSKPNYNHTVVVPHVQNALYYVNALYVFLGFSFPCVLKFLSNQIISDV